MDDKDGTAAVDRFAMTCPPKPKRRWYQCSLRTLFVVMTLFAIACSWYAYEMNKAAKRRAAIEGIIELEGYVGYYDTPLDPPEKLLKILNSDPNPLREPSGWFSWLRKLHLHEDVPLGNAVVVAFRNPHVTDAELLHLEGLTNLQCLCLVDTQITDAGLVHLKGLTNLTYLDLTGSQVTDEGVKKLQEALPNCDIVH